MEKRKLFAGVLLFGSLWGFSECIIGSMLRNAALPAGSIMTGVFALGLKVMNKIVYKTRGMQLGMGLIAGILRLLNPFGGCYICSAIAIMAEGIMLEILWSKISLDFKELNTLTIKTSMGIVTSYCVYVVGYVVTQILTPVFSSAGFYIENLILFIPQILASGLLAAVIGGIIAPTMFLLKKYDTNIVRNRLYYPTTIGISALCWLIVIANTILK